MFSLIITLIAIALVAALALATLYYGGPIFNEGADRAQAAKIEAQGQQIMGAMELYHAEKGVYPAALADLVTDEYLKSIPTATAEQAQLVASALAATGTWSLVSPGQPVIVMKPVSLATCKSFNSVNVGVSGVLKYVHSTKLKQCVGTDVNNLMIIQPKAVADLLYVAADVGAAVQIGTVLSTPIPALSDTSANGFLDTTASSSVTYAVSYSTPALAFPDTANGSTSAAQSVTVTNSGTGALTITGAAASAPFGVSASDCTAVAPGATCSVSVTFSPPAEQLYSGASYALTLTSPNGILAGLPLTGTGTGASGTNIPVGATQHIAWRCNAASMDIMTAEYSFNDIWCHIGVGPKPAAYSHQDEVTQAYPNPYAEGWSHEYGNVVAISLLYQLYSMGELSALDEVYAAVTVPAGYASSAPVCWFSTAATDIFDISNGAPSNPSTNTFPCSSGLLQYQAALHPNPYAPAFAWYDQLP